MKHPLIILLVLCFGLSPLTTIAQNTDDYQPPSLQRLRMEKVEDFERYEPQILEAIQFIKSTPLNSNDKRKDKAVVFFFKWLEGSANAIIEVNPYVGAFLNKNESLVIFFFTGWTEFVLNDKSQKKNYLDANVAGVKAMLEYYKKGKEFGIKKDKQVLRLIELQEQGKLKEFIQEATGLEEFVPEETEEEQEAENEEQNEEEENTEEKVEETDKDN